MTITVPTLSSQGWVSTIEEKGDRALSYFITSDYSQSVLYQGNVITLQYLIQQHGTSPTTLEREIQRALEETMQGYFGEAASVIVQVEEPDPEKPGQLTIHFNCIVREDGREYSLGRRVRFMNSRLLELIKINNG